MSLSVLVFGRTGRIGSATGITPPDAPPTCERPRTSTLDCSHTRQVCGLALPDRQAALDRIAASLPGEAA